MRRPRSPRFLRIAPVLLGLALLAGTLGLAAHPTRADSTVTKAVSGTIVGPAELGAKLSANYTLHAAGGILALNGTSVSTYAFNATLQGPNTTGSVVTPSTGVFRNASATIRVTAPPVLQRMTLSILVRASANGKNVSNNLTYAISVVQPFRLSATLLVGKSAAVGPFSLTVTLDGGAVGSVPIPVLTAGATYPVSFPYVATNLAPGWHTFAISLAQLHGLVTFPGGVEQYTQSFYVSGPGPDLTPWYFAGTAAFVGAIFIWMTRVAARRQGRAKK